ncbi:hypothetical protein BY458DRAFT_507228 [Sporodiniella umbellata]|nr:hypothetical protein BY458DRAFT_507228 [Sporodiniella umbellata]
MFKSRQAEYDDTLFLAQFLSTTGPEEFSKQKRQMNRASRILDKLRKRPQDKPDSLRDSGVYTDESDSETILTLREFPQPPKQRTATQTLSLSANKTSCPHCRQSMTSRPRRPSCPPALASGPTVETNTKLLLAMVQDLKQQLLEEKESRLKLEKAIHRIEKDQLK